MNVSHILYKVDKLDNAVQRFRKEGFTVEYGTKKNPHNALIYFSQGPYLELFHNSGMPGFLKSILSISGKKAFIDRLNQWEHSQEGLIGMALENYSDNLESERSILRRYNENMFIIPSKRRDSKGRVLKFTCGFPDNMKIPFMMTYFSQDPKPVDYVHPNGVESIESISFGTDKHLLALIHELCDDKRMKLFAGAGVKDLRYKRV